jgi:hypothetical protein
MNEQEYAPSCIWLRKEIDPTEMQRWEHKKISFAKFWDKISNYFMCIVCNFDKCRAIESVYEDYNYLVNIPVLYVNIPETKEHLVCDENKETYLNQNIHEPFLRQMGKYIHKFRRGLLIVAFYTHTTYDADPTKNDTIIKELDALANELQFE